MNKKILKLFLSFVMVLMIILSGRNTENVFADSIDPNDYIKNINIIDNKGEKESWFKGYKIEDGKIILEVSKDYVESFWNWEEANKNIDENKLIIETENIEDIMVNNPISIPENEDWGFTSIKGVKDFKAKAEEWGKGINFSEIGAYVEGWDEQTAFFSKDTPPEFTFTTTNGQSFTLPWEVVEFKGDDEEDIKFEIIISANSNNKNVDKEIEVGILVDDKLLGEQRVELEPGKPYNIQAKDGTRTKFKEWKLETNYIDDLESNFEKYFSGKKTDENLQFTLTEKLIEELKELPENKRYINLEAKYDEYTSVEIELKEELKTTDLSTMTKRSINMMEYSMETEEYKDRIRLLKNNINNDYTHKLDDTMGEAYIILKDKDGKLKEKFSSSLNEDIILAYSSIFVKESDTVELIAIPKEDYEFEKWQIITPAIDMETEWGIEPQYLNPESGVFCEIKSPYIKTELQAMQNKGEGHIKRFRARAIFKSINEGEQKEIDTIQDIHKEYIKGYTDVSDVFPKTVEVKFKDSDEKVAIAVDWGAVDLESIASGEHIIKGRLRDPRFFEKEAKLYLNVKEIRGFKELTQKASLINSNFFTGSGKSHTLPKTVEVKIFDGEKENVVELDAKWKDKELSEDRSYEVQKGTICFYKHGKFTANGGIKGYDEEIQYELEVIPGNTVRFLVDDNFKKSGNGYVYTTLNSIDIKKGELILEPEETPKRSGYISAGWYSNASYSDPLDLNAGKKFKTPQELGENEMTGSSYPLYNKWRELFIDTIENIEIEVDSQLPDKITINTTDKDIVEVDVKEWKQETVDLSQAGEYIVKAIIEWKLEDKEVDVNIKVKDKTVEKQKHTITFNTNGGSNIPPTEVEEGQKLTKPTDPIREGYKFISWYSDEGLTEKFDFNTEITENITLYAKWEEEPNEPIQEILEITSVELIKEGKVISKGVIKGKNITLELPEGYDESIIEGNHILKITGTEGANLAQDRGYDGPIEKWAAGDISNSIMAGQSKKFTIYKDDNSVDYTIEILEATEPTPPVEDKYTITFNSNGGSSVNPQILKANEKVYRPADPTKSDYKFIGWYEDSSLTRVFDFNTPITENITLFAKWEKSDSPTPKPSEKKDARINKFSLAGIPGVINHDRETIDIYLPFNIDLDYLVPDINYEGDEIYPSISKPQDFNRTVYYTITGRDYNSKTYKVYVDMPRGRDRYDRQTYYEDWYKPLSGKTKGKSKDDKDWYEISQEIKKKRLEEEKSPSLTSKEVKAAALNKAGQITAQSGGIRRDVSIKQFSDHMEVKQNSKDKGDFIKNQINIPSGVLTELNELGFDYLKYSTNLVRVKIFPFMDSADGVIINIRPAPSEQNNDIQYIWAKTKGAGKLFEIETNSTKAGLSFEMKLDKKLPAEYIRVVKFNYMKQKFEDLSPEKWSVVNERVYVEQVSGGIYGIIYKK